MNGFSDGAKADARFRHPFGMTLSQGEHTLYVAGMYHRRLVADLCVCSVCGSRSRSGDPIAGNLFRFERS